MDTNIYVSWLSKSKNKLETDPLFQEIFSNATYRKVLDMKYLISTKNGTNAVFSLNDELVTLQLYRQGMDDYEQFKWELPHKLHFGMDRTQIRALLGKPDESKEAVKDHPMLGDIEAFDRFVFEDHSIHFRYADKSYLPNIISIDPKNLFDGDDSL